MALSVNLICVEGQVKKEHFSFSLIVGNPTESGSIETKVVRDSDSVFIGTFGLQHHEPVYKRVIRQADGRQLLRTAGSLSSALESLDWMESGNADVISGRTVIVHVEGGGMTTETTLSEHASIEQRDVLEVLFREPAIVVLFEHASIGTRIAFAEENRHYGLRLSQRAETR